MGTSAWRRRDTKGNVFIRGGLRLLACGGLAALASTLTPPATTLALGRLTTDDRPPEIAAPFSPLSGQSSSDTSVTIGLTVARTNPMRPTLALRGRSVDREDPAAFKVDTRISRIPCAGEYRFHAATEDTSNGNSSSYTALLRLFDPSIHPAGERCGVAPPPLPGRMSVLLQSQAESLFLVKGSRSHSGAFEGRLSLHSLPECDKIYELAANLELAGSSRGIEFKVQTISFSVSLQGKPADSKRC